jgi:hypothetical protein
MAFVPGRRIPQDQEGIGEGAGAVNTQIGGLTLMRVVMAVSCASWVLNVSEAIRPRSRTTNRVEWVYHRCASCNA